MEDFPTFGAPTKTTAGVSNLTMGALRKDLCNSKIAETGGDANSLNCASRLLIPSSIAISDALELSASLTLVIQSLPDSRIIFRASCISSRTSIKVKPSFFCLAAAVKSATTRSKGWSFLHSDLYPLTISRKGMQSAIVRALIVSAPCFLERLRAFFISASAFTVLGIFLALSRSSPGGLTTGRRRRPPVLLDIGFLPLGPGAGTGGAGGVGAGSEEEEEVLKPVACLE